MYSHTHTYLTFAMHPVFCRTLFFWISGTTREHSYHIMTSNTFTYEMLSVDATSSIRSVAVNVICTPHLLDKLSADIRHFNIFTDYSLTIRFDDKKTSAAVIKERVSSAIREQVCPPILSLAYETANEVCFIMEYPITEKLFTERFELSLTMPYSSPRCTTGMPFTWNIPLRCFATSSLSMKQQWLAFLQQYLYFDEHHIQSQPLSHKLLKKQATSRSRLAVLESITRYSGVELQIAWAYQLCYGQLPFMSSLALKIGALLNKMNIRVKPNKLESLYQRFKTGLFYIYVLKQMFSRANKTNSLSSMNTIKAWKKSMMRPATLEEKVKRLICSSSAIVTKEWAVAEFYAELNRMHEDELTCDNQVFNKSKLPSTLEPSDYFITELAFSLKYSDTIHVPDIHAWCADALTDMPYSVRILNGSLPDTGLTVNVSVRVLMRKAWLPANFQWAKSDQHVALIQKLADKGMDICIGMYANITRSSRLSRAQKEVNTQLSLRQHKAQEQLVALWKWLFEQQNTSAS